MKRKTMAALLLAIQLLAAVPVYGAAGDQPYTLTIDKAVELTLQNSPALQQVDVLVDLAERGKIDANNLYDDLKDQVQNNAGGIKQKMAAAEMQIGALQQAYATAPDADKAGLAAEIATLQVQHQGLAYSLDSLVSLWDSMEQIGDIADRAKEGYDDARKAREDAKEKLKYSIEKLYLSMLTLEDGIRLQSDNVNVQKALVNIERAKFENGFSTAVKVDQSSRKVREEEKNLRDLQNTFLLLKYQMNRNIGRDWDAPLALAPVTFQPVATSDMKQGFESAQQSDLALEQYNRPIKNKNEDLTDNRGDSDNEDRINLEIAQAKLNIEDTRFQLRTTLEKLHYNLEDAQKQLADARSNYETARVEYENTKTQFEQGMALQLALDAGKLSMDKAFNEYTRAVHAYYLAARELQLAEQGIVMENS